MNSSSHSPNCSEFASSVAFVPEWRPNFFYNKIYVQTDIDYNRQSAVSPLTIFLDLLFILAVKTTPQLRNKFYNALLACFVGTEIMAGALGQLFSELIYRLSGSPASEFCIITHAARHLSRAFGFISLQLLALIREFRVRKLNIYC